MSTKFLATFEESNNGKKRLVDQWVLSNIDYSQVKKALPVCFYRNTSFYLTELPVFTQYPPGFKDRVFAALVDRDIQEDLERAGLINWCRNVRRVIAINVPKDGNCLLHSVATAVWGITDKNLLLRRMLGLALGVDTGRRFHDRWMRHRQIQISLFVDRLLDSGAEGMQNEWKDISQCLDPDRSHSTAVPYRFLEAIHVYTLANILRRPIIVLTDPTMRTFSGLSLQDNDMGGIYLPLEWSWKDTNCTPILIGYSHSHFCPMLFADHPNQAMAGATQKRDLAPLVNGRFEQLPVRFLLEGEEPEVGALLRKYLKVKETVMQVNENIQNILCAELETSSLPAELNLVNDYVQDSLKRFRNEAGLASAQQLQYEMALVQSQLRMAEHQRMQQTVPNVTGQAPGSPHRVTREQLQRTRTNEYALGDPALQRQSTVRIPPPSFTPWTSLAQQNVSLNPPQDKKCVVPSCKYFGDPELGMMCSNCFRNYTVKESRQMGASKYSRSLPTAPLASIPVEEEQYQPSMMAERCKEGCGYRCSTQTYPYCHECVDKMRRQAQEKAQMMGSQSAGPNLVTFEASGNPAVSPAMLPSSPVPQEGLKVEVPGQPLDSKQVEASVSASPILLAGAESQVPQTVQAPSGVTSSVPAGEESSNAASPTRALAAVKLTAPLTPPEDTNDLMLFGSGQQSPVSGGVVSPVASQPPALVPANQVTAAPSLTSQQQTPASPSQVKPVLSFTSQPQTHVPGQNDQQKLFSSQYIQEQQQQPQSPKLTLLQGQGLLSSAVRLTESQLATVITGAEVNELSKVECSASGCNTDMVLKGLCGKCYMHQGHLIPAVEKLKTSINSTASSAPASIGVGANTTGANAIYTREMGASQPEENKSTASSMIHLPSTGPLLTNSRVQNWLDENSKVPAKKIKKEMMMASGPRSEPLGLPEKQESEPLNSSDLLASGAECFSSTNRCMGEGCSNPVQQEKQLCQQCQDILRSVRQGQRQEHGQEHSSVQESLPHQRMCLTEGCSFYGIEANLGYCSDCYGRLFKRQLEEEIRHTHPANVVRSVPLPQSPSRVIRVPPVFHQAPRPMGKQGQPCAVAGCNLFGDPEQAGMCWKHFQQHRTNLPIAPGKATHSAPVANTPRAVINIPYASQLNVTPTSATIYTPALNREVIFETGGSGPGSCPVGEVSVPPPSSPRSESGFVGRPRLSEPSLDEMYNRVAGHHAVKCINPSCHNFGNRSKGGFCNSCASDPQISIGRIIYGEEQTG